MFLVHMCVCWDKICMYLLIFIIHEPPVSKQLSNYKKWCQNIMSNKYMQDIHRISRCLIVVVVVVVVVEFHRFCTSSWTDGAFLPIAPSSRPPAVHQCPIHTFKRCNTISKALRGNKGHRLDTIHDITITDVFPMYLRDNSLQDVKPQATWCLRAH